MMKSTAKKFAFTTVLLLVSSQGLASSDNLPVIGIQTAALNSSVTASHYNQKMVYQPSQYLLEREKRGHVTIYDGFTDVEVDSALDQNFDRIQNMMFTRVKMTDQDGDVMIDPETGNEIVSDDGCDD